MREALNSQRLKHEKETRQMNISRRELLMGGSALAAAFSLPGATFGATDRTKGLQVGDITMKGVQFKNNGITMAGNLYFPKGLTDSGKYPAIVSIHPGGGVKEQTAGLYAQRLAEQGFVTLAFDASHQGASGGMPRFLDDPMKRVGDIYSAVDYLTSLPYVDAGRIGALGICAGSGAAIKAASTERRIKAAGTVSAVDVGAATARAGTVRPRSPIRSQCLRQSPSSAQPKRLERRRSTSRMCRTWETPPRPVICKRRPIIT
jgi:uncharacterized protein